MQGTYSPSHGFRRTRQSGQSVELGTEQWTALLAAADRFTLLTDIRSIYADIPAVLTVDSNGASSLDDDRALQVEKPFSTAIIHDALVRLGLRETPIAGENDECRGCPRLNGTALQK
ncbi:hypothetical protein [Sphingomonas sp. OTU376]|uniref:hypothetical protein n=1 Tax=Sphingomonas sp. OTU376 TaxID=3043863 RepID=UPI00313E4291